MPRKPLVIVVIAVCFLLSPAFIVLQASVFTLTPVIGPYHIFAKLSAHDLLVLIVYPVCAAAVFFVKKWGWYVFVAAALFLIADNVVVFLLRPQYHLFALVGYDLVLVAAAGIFFRRAVIAPYFNPSLRWWEQPVRFRIGVYLLIRLPDGTSAAANIVDVSESGLFALCAGRLPPETDLDVELHALGHRIFTRVRVRRRVERRHTVGYGLQFVHPDRTQGIALRTLLGDFRRAGLVDQARLRFAGGKAEASAPRFRVNAVAEIAEIAAAGRRRPAVLLDLSRTGCLLRAPDAGAAGLMNGFRAIIGFHDLSAEVPCVPRWFGCLDDAPVCGAAFRYESPSQKRLVRRVIAASRRAGAVDRRKSARPLPEEKIRELALRSPYRLVERVKGLFVKR